MNKSIPTHSDIVTPVFNLWLSAVSTYRAIIILFAASTCAFALSGCSQRPAGVNIQAGLLYSPDNGSIRAVIVNNQSAHPIESATVQIDFHLQNGDVVTKKQEADRIDKESSWRYELDQPLYDVVSVEITVTGRDGHGKISLPGPSTASTAKLSHDNETDGNAGNTTGTKRKGDCQQFAQIVGKWVAVPGGGYLTIEASGQFEWGAGGSKMTGTCTLEDSMLRLAPSEIKERGKEVERLPANNAKFLEFKVTSLNPLILKQRGTTMKYTGLESGDDDRGNVATEIKAAPEGEPSVNLTRTYIMNLHKGWRAVHLDHEFVKGSLIATVRDGQRYWIVMMTDSGHTQRVPAQMTRDEFYAVLFPTSVKQWDEDAAESYWQSIKSATFWIEYSEDSDSKGFRVSPVVEVTRPDFG